MIVPERGDKRQGQEVHHGGHTFPAWAARGWPTQAQMTALKVLVFPQMRVQAAIQSFVVVEKEVTTL